MFRNHPPGLKVLFFTEMWERFGYYLLIGILMLYMTDVARGGLGFDKEQGASVYGWFVALVYLTPFFGGIIADQYLGYRKSVVLGGLLMAAGYLGIALLPGHLGFYAALGLVVVGNGFFKPNMSTIVAIGNKMAGVLAGFWESMSIEHIFWINCMCALGAALALAVMIPWIRRTMHEHERQVSAAAKTVAAATEFSAS